MKESTYKRLLAQLPTKNPHICYSTYLPLVPSFRENDWEKNVSRVDLHKKLVNVELNEDGTKIIQKVESSEKLGRGHKSGSRTLLEDFLVSIDLENYQALGKTLYTQGYLNDMSARTFLLEASELIDGKRLDDDELSEVLKTWKILKEA